jgi:hypothetical protein
VVDEIGDTGESNTRDCGRGVEEVRGNVFEAKNFPKVLAADRVKLLKLGEGPTGVFPNVSDARDDACVGDEDLVVREALLGEKGFEVLMDRSEKALEVVGVRVVVAVV